MRIELLPETIWTSRTALVALTFQFMMTIKSSWKKVLGYILSKNETIVISLCMVKFTIVGTHTQKKSE